MEEVFPENVDSAEKDKTYSSQSAVVLLGKGGLLVLVALLLVSAWFGQVMLVVLLGLLVSMVGLTRLWSWCSLAGVSCQRFLSERRAFPGEDIELKIRLANGKPLPLPWVRVDDEIPDGLSLDNVTLGKGNRAGARSLNHVASLLWYTAMSWRYQLHCKKRGYYTIGPLVATSGDIFGFYPRSMSERAPEHVIVYPKLYPIVQLGVPSLAPIGETRAERRIFEDPTRTIGVREYRPCDSLRYVHWKASARHQDLEVKVFEPTTTLKTVLFLAVDSFQSYLKDTSEDFELGISTAASIANYVVNQHSPVGLFANALLPDSEQPVKIMPAVGSYQLLGILETLAKFVMVPTGPFDEFLQREQRSLPWGATVIVIVHKPSEFLVELMTGLNRSGYKSMAIQIGEHEEDSLQHKVAWYNVRSPGDLSAITFGRER